MVAASGSTVTRAVVDRERGALGDLQQRGADADEQRDAERPGDDRRVVQRAAAGGDDAPGGGGVELGDGAGRQLVGDDDPRLRGLARLAAEQLEQHPVRDVADVDRARSQVGVVDAVERGGDLVGRVP